MVKQIKYQLKKGDLVQFRPLVLGRVYHTRKGVAIQEISKMMGHEDVSTTMIYTHMKMTKINNKARRMF